MQDNQIIKALIDFFLNPTFLYWTLGISILLILDINISLLLRKKNIIRAPKKPETKSLWRKTKYHIGSFYFKIIGLAIFINIILVSTLVAATCGIVIPEPKVTFPTEAALGVSEITPDNPVEIKFDRPINKNNLNYEISPELEGTWEFSNQIAPTKLYYKPKVSPRRGERYQISLTNIKSLIGNGDGGFLFSFQAPPLSKIQEISPKNGDQGVLPNQDIIFSLDHPAGDTLKIDYVLSPDIETELIQEEQKYIIRPKEGFKKSTGYQLTIWQTPMAYNFETKESKEAGTKKELAKQKFRIIEAPGIDSYMPKGSGVLTNSPVKITFKQDMDKEATQKAFSMSPKVDGDFSWEGNRVLRFGPKSLAKNTKYTVTVSKDTKASDGSPFEETFNFDFTTIGYVTASIYPANGSGGVALGTSVKITFNQTVDHASAQSKFSLSNVSGGSFSWSGNTMIYSHKNFSYSTTYTASVASGVKSVNGLDSNKGYSSKFTTQAQSTMLSVPSYAQSYTYSCMLAAAKSALAYRGVHVSESTLYNKIAKDGTPFSGSWPSNVHWGNPNNGFVGGLNGSNPPGHGYGAHWGPVANMMSSYRSVQVKSGWNVQGIASEISAGNPVIIWWVNGVWPAYTINWFAGSTKVYAVNSMHVVVVKGFTGTVDNPTSFSVTDSGYGYPGGTYSTSAFKAKWAWFNNTGIIVR